MAFIFLFLLIHYSKQQIIQPLCACKELSQQSDCEKNGCSWITNGESIQKCVAYENSCSQIKNQKSCDKTTGCGWTNQQNCAPFTQCSDYTSSNEYGYDCFEKGQYSCIPGNTYYNGSPECVPRLEPCSDIKDPRICNGFISGQPNSFCWFSNSCIFQDVTDCTTITNFHVCELFGCVYKFDSCTYHTCSDYINEFQCEFFDSDLSKYYPKCNWSNNQCIESERSSFDSYSCFTKSQGTYAWDGSVCQSCQSNTQQNITLIVVLSVLLPIIVLIILILIRQFVKHQKSKRYLEKQQYQTQLNLYMPTTLLQVNESIPIKYCSICQNKFQMNCEVKISYCKHIYHSECISEWTKQSQECPQCKSSFEENILKQKFNSKLT